jgi:hypothetical protein
MRALLTGGTGKFGAALLADGGRVLQTGRPFDA